MSDYKEILTSDRVYKKYKSIIPDTNVSIDDIIQKFQRILLKRVRKY